MSSLEMFLLGMIASFLIGGLESYLWVKYLVKRELRKREEK